MWLDPNELKSFLTDGRINLSKTLQWHHNGHEGISYHQPNGCLLNRLFRRRSKETSKLRVTGLCVGNSPGPVNSPHKGPVTRKMFPFDDVIMIFSAVNADGLTRQRDRASAAMLQNQFTYKILASGTDGLMFEIVDRWSDWYISILDSFSGDWILW